MKAIFESFVHINFPYFLSHSLLHFQIAGFPKWFLFQLSAKTILINLFPSKKGPLRRKIKFQLNLARGGLAPWPVW